MLSIPLDIVQHGSPTFSIVTPSHNLLFLKEAARSVLAQLETNWEWIVLINGPVEESPDAVHALLGGDRRIRVIRFGGNNLVGSLKKCACMCARGLYIVELDHDDELSVDCLAELRAAFEGPQKPVFVYSDFAPVTADGMPYMYGSAYGWEYSSRTFKSASGESSFMVPCHPEALPQNVGRIYYAPNHVRSWRRDAYMQVGGHDESLKVCDDLDLMCKLFLNGKFVHVNKVLYRYNVHKDNTWKKFQDEIDSLSITFYAKYIEQMSLVHARGKGLGAFDLGGGIGSPHGWTTVDVHSAVITADLSRPWPLDTNSAGVLRASDFVEHIKDPIHLMNEAYRVLNHGGLFLINVPSTDGRGAFQDPSHVSFWNSNCAWYYTKAETQHYIKHLGIKCRFQAVHVENYFPSEWHKLHNIVYTKMHLAAIKDGPRLHGLIEI